MATARVSLLVLAFVALAWSQAKAAPAPFPKPKKTDTRKAALLRLEGRLIALGVTWKRLTRHESEGLWWFACTIPHPVLTKADVFVDGYSTDEDGLGAITEAVLAAEDRIRDFEQERRR